MMAPQGDLVVETGGQVKGVQGFWGEAEHRPRQPSAGRVPGQRPRSPVEVAPPVPSACGFVTSGEGI